MLRKAKDKEVAEIMVILDQAREYMLANNLNQWTKDYPLAIDVEDDIAAGVAYVYEEAGQIVAYGAIINSPEPDYLKIDGTWLNDAPYKVIHRMAVRNDQKGKGIAGKYFDEALILAAKEGIFDLRIDTGFTNNSMQRSLEKNGFVKCGVIILAKNGGLRYAYQKTTNTKKSIKR